MTTVRLDIHIAINGKLQDEPIGFVELDNPGTANIEIAATFRQLARNLEQHDREQRTDNYGAFFRDEGEQQR